MSISLSVPLKTICALTTSTLSALSLAQTSPIYRITDLGSLADVFDNQGQVIDEGNSVALGINLLNEVVGQSRFFGSADNAFVWLPVDNYPGLTGGPPQLPKYTMLDLGSGANGLSDVANDISNNGQIAGMTADGSTVDKARVWDLTTGVTSTLFSRSFRIGPAVSPVDSTGWLVNNQVSKGEFS